MTTIMRLQANLAGWTGGPGVSSFYFTVTEGEEEATAVTCAGLLNSMYFALRTYYVQGLTVNIDPTVDLVEHTNGELQGRFSISPPGGVSSTGAVSGSSRASMLKTRFFTNTVSRGRLMRGGVFIGPIGASAFDAAGQIPSPVISAVSDAFEPLLLIEDAALIVWGRPVPFTPGPPPEDARDGAIGLVTAVSCAPRPGTLRSRRD